MTGEAGVSTIINTGESITRREEGSIIDVGESAFGESGGASKGDSSPEDFLQAISYLSFVSKSFIFFFAGSFSSFSAI